MRETHANAFSVDPGRCYRFVATEQAKGQPIPCPGRVVTRGRSKRGGAWPRFVDAYEGRASGVER